MALAKPHPPFPATFVNGKLAITVQIADIKCFRAHSICWIAAGDTGKLYGQGRFCNKGKSNCQSQPLSTISLPHAPGNQATGYGCVYSSTCYICSVRPVVSGDVSHTVTAALHQFNTSTAAHSTIHIHFYVT